MRSAVRALAWKEWREQRPVVLTALGLAALMPFVMVAGASWNARGVDLAALASVMPVVCAALLWTFFAAAAGGATISREIEDGTIGFLLSRPMPRSRIWGVKIVVGALSTLLILAGSLAVAWIFWIVAHRDGVPFAPGVLPTTEFTGITTLLFAGATFLIFAASVFFSTVLSRAMNAAAAGLAASLLILGGIVLLWSRLDVVPGLEPGLFMIEILLAGTVSLVASLYLFCSGELLRGHGARKRALLAGIASLGLFGIVTVPTVWAHVRLSPGSAVLTDLTPSPSGDAVFATAMSGQGGSPEIWQIHSDGTGIERLMGRLTGAPAVSPDGKWVAYLSLRGALGLRMDRAELRAMRVDGSGDHLVAVAPSYVLTPYQGNTISYSPDGRSVAILAWRSLLIASIDGGKPTLVDLPSGPIGPGAMAGWTSDGSEVLVLSQAARGETGSTLGAVEAATGRTRVIYQEKSRRMFHPFMTRRLNGWKHLPVFLDTTPGERGGIDLALIDLHDGNAVRVNGGVCAMAAQMSDDERFLVYATCSPTARGETESVLHAVDLVTGFDRAIAPLHGRVWSILLSPANDKVLVHRFGPDNKPVPATVVSLDGSRTDIEAGWVPLGWQGRDRIVLFDEGPPARLAVAAAEGGAPRVIYP